MKADELARRIDLHLEEHVALYGEMGGKKVCSVYECDDAFVTTPAMTYAEAYYVECAIFGQAIADTNYDVLTGKQAITPCA